MVLRVGFRMRIMLITLIGSAPEWKQLGGSFQQGRTMAKTTKREAQGDIGAPALPDQEGRSTDEEQL